MKCKLCIGAQIAMQANKWQTLSSKGLGLDCHIDFGSFMYVKTRHLNTLLTSVLSGHASHMPNQVNNKMKRN